MDKTMYRLEAHGISPNAVFVKKKIHENMAAAHCKILSCKPLYFTLVNT